jgi:hypothetical protein
MPRLWCDLPNDAEAAAPVVVANVGDLTTLYSEAIESFQLGRDLPIPGPKLRRIQSDLVKL